MDIISQLALVIGLGIAAQWLAWRMGLPSILLLLVFGFAAGPWLGWVRPDEIFGEALFPVVSLAVGLILFEGGMSLKFSELKGLGVGITMLVLVGALVTWGLSTLVAHYVLEFGWMMSILTGAILVVTGPTVILPLLRQVRPSPRLRVVLKWEGITIDPVGATLALLVFESMLPHENGSTAAIAVEGILRTLLAGGLIGVVSAAGVIFVLRRYWVPDDLQEVVTLAIVLGAFTVSNHFQEESGLLTVTVMGVVMANQRWATVHHILHFKENLRVLFISALFIVLASRIPLADLASVGVREAIFVGVLILLVRPVAVYVSTIGAGHSWRERLFLGCLAPRGIVAAAVASLFSLRLQQANVEGAAELVPVVFTTIVGTVFLYGIVARPLARALGLTERDPQGILIVGAHVWAQSFASVLKEEDIPCSLVDTNWTNVVAAKLRGLDAHYGSVLSEEVIDDLDLDGIGKLLAITSNNEANALAALHFARMFGRDQIYQITPEGHGDETNQDFSPRHLRGRYAFGRNVTFQTIARRSLAGATMKVTALTENFDYKAFRDLHGEDAIPLAVLSNRLGVRIVSDEPGPDPEPGDRLIYLSSSGQDDAKESGEQDGTDAADPS